VVDSKWIIGKKPFFKNLLISIENRYTKPLLFGTCPEAGAFLYVRQWRQLKE
jgi:hypothetical protein